MHEGWDLCLCGGSGGIDGSGENSGVGDGGESGLYRSGGGGMSVVHRSVGGGLCWVWFSWWKWWME